jgi:hypothetical protein
LFYVIDFVDFMAFSVGEPGKPLMYNLYVYMACTSIFADYKTRRNFPVTFGGGNRALE